MGESRTRTASGDQDGKNSTLKDGDPRARECMASPRPLLVSPLQAPSLGLFCGRKDCHGTHARAELTAAQRTNAIKRRKQIWEALHPAEIQVGKVCPPESATGYKQPPPQEKGFAALTAAAAGMTKRAIKRRKQIWEALHPGETGDATCASSLSDGRKAGPQHEKQFAADTASVSGESKSQINRHLARAEAIGEDLERCQRDAVLRSPNIGADVGLNVGPCFRLSQFLQ